MPVNESDIKIIRDTLKDAEDTYNSIKESLRKSIVEEYGLKHEILESILQYTKEDIETKDVKELHSYLSQYNMTAENEFTDEEVRSTLTQIKDISNIIWSSKKNLDGIKKEAKEILEEYNNYGSSNKERRSIKETLSTLREAEKLEKDFHLKKELQKKIYILEQCLSLDFVTERIRDIGAKEINSINDGFFTFNKGSYVIERFKKKITKIGFNESLYYNFFNLEEYFLPEKYHVYNNLFLYIYMRMVAYCDPYDVRDVKWMKHFTGSFSRLFYHKFEKEEDEKHFLDIVMQTLDYFSEYHDKYEENNTTQPHHKVRIEMEQKRKEKEKEVVVKKLNEFGITDFDPEDTTENLRKLLMDKVDSMTNEQYPTEEESSKVDVTEEEDGSVTVAPKITTDESEPENSEEVDSKESENETNKIDGSMFL